MKMEISKRDRKLLVFLSIFVVVVCLGYWGVRPQFRSIGKMKNDISDEQNTKDMNELKILQLEALQDNNENLETQISKAKKNYFEIMKSSDIDKYFTTMVLGYGLKALDLDISMPSDVTELEPYKYSQKYVMSQVSEEYTSSQSGTDEQSEIDAVDAAAGNETDNEVSSIEGNDTVGIYAATVNMRLGGDEKTLLKFLDDISNTEQKIRLVNYSWSGEKNVETDEEGNYVMTVDSTLNVSLEIYMCED